MRLALCGIVVSVQVQQLAHRQLPEPSKFHCIQRVLKKSEARQERQLPVC